MASKYWIKLYHEILHDPKMGKLPDHLWRRTIEAFLIAGEYGDDGRLPCPSDVAWTLRTTEEEIVECWDALTEAGIVTKDMDGWYVTKFAARQAAVSGQERLKRFRERQHRAQYDGNEIATTRYVDADVETDTESDADAEGANTAPEEPPAPATPRTVLEILVQETGEKLPDRKWADRIVESVPLDALEAWRQHCAGWIGSGYKGKNLVGLLDRWKTNPISLSNGNGHTPLSDTGPPVVVDASFYQTPAWMGGATE